MKIAKLVCLAISIATTATALSVSAFAAEAPQSDAKAAPELNPQPFPPSGRHEAPSLNPQPFPPQRAVKAQIASPKKNTHKTVAAPASSEPETNSVNSK